MPGVLLCILSPVCFLALAAYSHQAAASPRFRGNGCGIGLTAQLLLVALFVSTGLRGEKWKFLEKEAFETEYGVTAMVREKYKVFRETFVRAIAIGVILCILSPVPLFLSMAYMVCVLCRGGDCVLCARGNALGGHAEAFAGGQLHRR